MLVKLSGQPDLSTQAIGGKANSVNNLIANGFTVPYSCVLTSNCIREALVNAGISIDYEPLIRQYQTDKQRGIRESLDRAKNCDRLDISATLFDNSSISTELISLLPNGMAVRSSAVPEDGRTQSFAGCFDSYYGGVTPQIFLSLVRDCISSAFAPAVIAYLSNHQLVPSFGYCVLIQSLVPSDVGGVAFTRNPVTGSADTILIEASFGSGITVVNGCDPVDRLYLDKQTGNHRYEIATKTSYTQITPAGTERVTSGELLAKTACLDEKKIAALYDASLALETMYKCAVDFEWTFADSELYILQSRPITA